MSSLLTPLLLKPQIFRAGCKVVLGSGAAKEERFITAIVRSADGGGGEVGGYGGSIVLEASLASNHAEGTRVATVRPGRFEAEGYRKRKARKLLTNLVGAMYSSFSCSIIISCNRLQM